MDILICDDSQGREIERRIKNLKLQLGELKREAKLFRNLYVSAAFENNELQEEVKTLHEELGRCGR